MQEADAFRVNPDTVPGSHPAAGLTAPVVDPAQHVQARMAPFWDESAVVRLSQLPNVERVVCLGELAAWLVVLQASAPAILADPHSLQLTPAD